MESIKTEAEMRIEQARDGAFSDRGIIDLKIWSIDQNASMLEKTLKSRSTVENCLVQLQSNKQFTDPIYASAKQILEKYPERKDVDGILESAYKTFNSSYWNIMGNPTIAAERIAFLRDRKKRIKYDVEGFVAYSEDGRIELFENTNVRNIGDAYDYLLHEKFFENIPGMANETLAEGKTRRVYVELTSNKGDINSKMQGFEVYFPAKTEEKK